MGYICTKKKKKKKKTRSVQLPIPFHLVDGIHTFMQYALPHDSFLISLSRPIPLPPSLQRIILPLILILYFFPIQFRSVFHVDRGQACWFRLSRGFHRGLCVPHPVHVCEPFPSKGRCSRCLVPGTKSCLEGTSWRTCTSFSLSKRFSCPRVTIIPLFIFSLPACLHPFENQCSACFAFCLFCSCIPPYAS